MTPPVLISLAYTRCSTLELGDSPASVDLLLSPIFRGPPGPPGASVPGPPGPSGSSGGTSYVFTQPTASVQWVISHGLGRFPSVTVVDSADNEVEGDVQYVDANHINVSFRFPFAGQAFLN